MEFPLRKFLSWLKLSFEECSAFFRIPTVMKCCRAKALFTSLAKNSHLLMWEFDGILSFGELYPQLWCLTEQSQIFGKGIPSFEWLHLEPAVPCAIFCTYLLNSDSIWKKWKEKYVWHRIDDLNSWFIYHTMVYGRPCYFYVFFQTF